jgi:hypothetical protein
MSGIFSAPGGGDTATIMNGVIAGFKGNAIESPGDFWTIENMRILSNSGIGVFVASWARIQTPLLLMTLASLVAKAVSSKATTLTVTARMAFECPPLASF